MLKIVVSVTLLATVFATPDVSELFDSFLKDTVDNQQLADGSFQTTYFNIPHRAAPGLIEPFLFGTRATNVQITAANIKRLTPVLKEVRRQQVWDGEDYDYNVLAVTLSMDINVINLAGDLTSFVGDSNEGQYSLNGSLRDLVLNVTMQTENGDYRVVAERNVAQHATTSNIIVTGDDQERAIVQLNAAEIVGDLVAHLLSNAISTNAYGDAGKALENAVRTNLADLVTQG